jgi:HEAT repeat protein
MQVKPCPFCQKPIPAKITACPYCHRDEQGQSMQMDSTAPAPEAFNQKFFDNDLQDLASADAFVREQATVRMAQKGFGVSQALISILSDGAKPGLAGVAKVLGRVRDKRAVIPLIQSMKLGDEELRIAAIWSLTQFREPEVLPALLAEVERQHPTIQSYMAYALGTFQDNRAVPMLSKLVRSPNREVAFHAAYSLAELRDPSSISALKKALRQKDPLVRAAVAGALRRLGVRAVDVPMAWGWIAAAGLSAGLGAAFFFYR